MCCDSEREQRHLFAAFEPMPLAPFSKLLGARESCGTPLLGLSATTTFLRCYPTTKFPRSRRCPNGDLQSCSLTCGERFRLSSARFTSDRSFPFRRNHFRLLSPRTNSDSTALFTAMLAFGESPIPYFRPALCFVRFFPCPRLLCRKSPTIATASWICNRRMCRVSFS